MPTALPSAASPALSAVSPALDAVGDPLAGWNKSPEAAAEAHLLSLCGCSRWARTLAAARPFDDAEHLHHAATNLWFLLDEADWLEAFSRHPRIGERKAAAGDDFLRHSAAEQAASEQSLSGHDPSLAQTLAAANLRYEERFGFLYIVFASGRTAPELLTLLTERLQRDRITELHEAARQQHAITTLRMRRWLEGEQ